VNIVFFSKISARRETPTNTLPGIGRMGVLFALLASPIPVGIKQD
jgi:hypothetical protein